jgi:hypothetical protein
MEGAMRFRINAANSNEVNVATLDRIPCPVFPGELQKDFAGNLVVEPGWGLGVQNMAALVQGVEGSVEWSEEEITL